MTRQEGCTILVFELPNDSRRVSSGLLTRQQSGSAARGEVERLVGWKAEGQRHALEIFDFIALFPLFFQI